MCLYTRQICPIKARRDIEVYKVLCYNSATDKIITPYMQFPVLTKTMDVSEESMKQGRCIGMCIIMKGMVHSYNFCPNLAMYGLRTFIVKAIIPKGTLYYKGLDGDYASKKLILKDIIDVHPKPYQLVEKIKRAYDRL